MKVDKMNLIDKILPAAIKYIKTQFLSCHKDTMVNGAKMNTPQRVRIDFEDAHPP